MIPSGNQPTIYTNQPVPTTLPELPSLPPNGEPSATMLLLLTFCVWLLRQQSKDK